MTTTIPHPLPTFDTLDEPAERPGTRRPKWPVFGVVAGAAGL